MTEETDRDAILASLETAEDREAFIYHDFWMKAVNDAISTGLDRKLLVEAMATVVASAAIQTHGAIGAARLLLSIYVPVRDAAVGAEEAAPVTMQ